MPSARLFADAFEICQSEDGAVGSIAEMQGGTVCDTKDGAKDSFYVLRVPDQEDVEEDEGEVGGLAKKLQKKVRDKISGDGLGSGFGSPGGWRSVAGFRLDGRGGGRDQGSVGGCGRLAAVCRGRRR